VEEQLLGRQLERLQQALLIGYRDTDLQELARFRLDVRLDHITLAGDLRQKTFDLVEYANGHGKARELVGAMSEHPNRDVRAIAAQIMKEWDDQRPMAWYSTDDPFRSYFLGPRPFVDRNELRSHLRDLISPHGNRVLIVTGPPFCGKSYSYNFIRYLRVELGSFKPILVDFRDWIPPSVCRPADLVESIAAMMHIQADLVVNPHEQDESLAVLMRNWLIKHMPDEGDPLLLVFDSLDQISLRPDTLELIESLALAAINEQLPRTRMILLGYADDRPTLQLPAGVAREEIGEIGEKQLCEFFEEVAKHAKRRIKGITVHRAVQRVLADLPPDRVQALRQLPEAIKVVADTVFGQVTS
jgi:hypothetical protein